MNPLKRLTPSWVLRGCEWIFVLFGAAVCVWVSITFASMQYNDLWPTPGLYFLEILLFTMAVLASRVVNIGPAKMDDSPILWMAGGVLLAFVILAGFSIGPYLFPAMAAFWLAAAISDLRQSRPALPHMALALITALFQGASIGLLLLISSAMIR